MTTKSELPPASLKWLEKIFEAEINDQLPFQTRAKTTFERLAGKNLIEPCVRTVPAMGVWPAIRIEGWQLTHLGRQTYCASVTPDQFKAAEAAMMQEQKQ